MSKEQVDELTRKCTTCGAVLKISPEDLVITCSYCGETFDVEGKAIPSHKMLPTVDVDAIQGNVKQFLKKKRRNPDLASIEETKLNYIPYWVCPFESQTHFYGVEQSSVTRYRTKTRTVTDANGKRRTETYQESYTVPVYRATEGDFTRTGRENVLARKYTAFFGFDEYQETLSLEEIQDFDFQKIKSLNAEFINAEVEPIEAQRSAYGRIENDNRKTAQSRVSKLVRCDSDINITFPEYVHVPLWQVRYRYDNKLFKMGASGNNGKILKGEVPITLKRRILSLMVGVLILVIAALLGQYGLYLNETLGIVLIIIAVIVMVLSFFITKNAFQVQMVKREKIKGKRTQIISMRQKPSYGKR
jgi:hypothetical protein